MYFFKTCMHCWVQFANVYILFCIYVHEWDLPIVFYFPYLNLVCQQKENSRVKFQKRVLEFYLSSGLGQLPGKHSPSNDGKYSREERFLTRSYTLSNKDVSHDVSGYILQSSMHRNWQYRVFGHYLGTR